MATFKHTGGGTAPRRSPRAKAIPQIVQKALSVQLARAIAHANVGHHDRAAEAAFRLLTILREHGVTPSKPRVG